jgi:hypothetical protein
MPGRDALGYTDEMWGRLLDYYFRELREPTAYHEAGHAVVGVWSGDARVELIDVTPRRGSTDWGFTRAVQPSVSRLDRLQDCTRRALYMCAGYEAQARVQPREAQGVELEWMIEEAAHEGGDYAEALDVLRFGGASPALAFRRLYHVRAFTEKVMQDPSIWAAVETVASALLALPPDDARLEGDALDDVLGQIDPMIGEAWRRVLPKVPPLGT